MNRSSRILSLALLLLLAGATAQAAAVVDPHVVGMGSSSLLAGPRTEDSPPADENVWVARAMLNSSEVFVVYRGDQILGYHTISGDPLLPGSEPGRILRPATGGNAVIVPEPDLDPVDLGGILTNRPHLNDPGYPEWLGLERKRKPRQGRDLPTGGDQPPTPLNPAPEPGTVMLLAMGLGAVGALMAARRWGLPTS